MAMKWVWRVGLALLVLWIWLVGFAVGFLHRRPAESCSRAHWERVDVDPSGAGGCEPAWVYDLPDREGRLEKMREAGRLESPRKKGVVR